MQPRGVDKISGASISISQMELASLFDSHFWFLAMLLHLFAADYLAEMVTYYPASWLGAFLVYICVIQHEEGQEC